MALSITKVKCFYNLNYVLILSTSLLLNIATAARYSRPSSYPNYNLFMERKNIDGLANEQICETPGCTKVAELLRDNIDERADPCDNFYNFACGGFVNKAKLIPPKTEVGHLESIQEKVIRELSKTFEEPNKPDEPRIFGLVKNYYKACVDSSAIEKIGLKPLFEIFDELGGWPILEGPKWNESKFDWMEADSILRAIGFPPSRIVTLFVFNDVFNTSLNLLHIAPPQLDIPVALLKRSLYDIEVLRYLNFMVDVAALLGAERTTARSYLTDVIKFERDIYEVISYGQSHPGKDSMTLKELDSSSKNIPWLKYLNGLTEPIAHLDGHNKVKLINSHYLNVIGSILSRTSSTVLANYMIWRVIAESIPNLNKEIRKVHSDYLNSISPYRAPTPARPKQCVHLVTDNAKGITVGVSALYTRKYFSNETKIDIKDIVHAIGDEFKSYILQVSWLDDTAKLKAIRKSLYMKQIVGYPNELDDDNLIDNYSRSLEIEPDRHFQNILNVQRFHYDDSIASLTEPAGKRTWITFSDATTINAYYYTYANSFVLLAAILQYPVYDSKWPAYAKYGSVGFVIGHETMHAFDVGGVAHDETGSILPKFSETVEKEYLSRVNCYVDQYNEYYDDSLNLNVNGELTVNENLSDNVGVKVALAAYKKWVKEHPDEATLPGLKYTPEQTFWISMVNFMCSKQTDDALLGMMLTDEHTPDKFRALGALSNEEEFAKVFKCPLGSKMNPRKKCNLL